MLQILLFDRIQAIDVQLQISDGFLYNETNSGNSFLVMALRIFFLNERFKDIRNFWKKSCGF